MRQPAESQQRVAAPIERRSAGKRGCYRGECIGLIMREAAPHLGRLRDHIAVRRAQLAVDDVVVGDRAEAERDLPGESTAEVTEHCWIVRAPDGPCDGSLV